VIFLTAGTQLPFCRLARAVDQWAARTGRGAEIFGQLPMAAGSFRPRAFEWVEMLPPAEHRAWSARADVILAHAGMGAVITALSLAKPVIVMPRRADLAEHRNDHQLATARWFGDRRGVSVVESEAALAAALDATAVPGRLAEGPDAPLSPFADPRLIDVIRAEIARA